MQRRWLACILQGCDGGGGGREEEEEEGGRRGKVLEEVTGACV
jgi:hypothetical protein